MDNTMITDAATPVRPAGIDSTPRRTGLGAHEGIERMAHAADDAARKAMPATDRAAHLAHEAVDKVADVARPDEDWLRERGNRLEATRDRLVQEATGYVAAKPWTCLAAAAVAGFLAGRLLR